MYYLPLRYSLSVRCGFLCIDAFAMVMADPLSCPCAISSPHGQKSQTGKKLALLHFDDYLLHLQHISIFKADQITRREARPRFTHPRAIAANLRTKLPLGCS